MQQVVQLEKADQWEDVFSKLKQPGARPCMVFKTSPYCPVSHMAHSAFNRALENIAATGLSLYKVDVINAREISMKIAEDTGVKHESPQAIIIGPGRKVLWQGSHSALTEFVFTSLLKEYRDPDETR